MKPESHLRMMGLLMMALAAANVWLPRRLRWPDQLQSLSPLNRQVFVVHAIFIVLITALFGFLSFAYAPELLDRTTLARAVMIGLALFWSARFLVQLVLCASPSCRGSGSDAVLQFLFAVACAYFAAVCAGTLACQSGAPR